MRALTVMGYPELLGYCLRKKRKTEKKPKHSSVEFDKNVFQCFQGAQTPLTFIVSGSQKNAGQIKLRLSVWPDTSVETNQTVLTADSQDRQETCRGSTANDFLKYLINY